MSDKSVTKWEPQSRISVMEFGSCRCPPKWPFLHSMSGETNESTEHETCTNESRHVVAHWHSTLVTGQSNSAILLPCEKVATDSGNDRNQVNSFVQNLRIDIWRLTIFATTLKLLVVKIPIFWMFNDHQNGSSSSLLNAWDHQNWHHTIFKFLDKLTFQGFTILGFRFHFQNDLCGTPTVYQNFNRIEFYTVKQHTYSASY